MSSAEVTLRAIQEALGPYIRPREEVSHIRRVLGVHLDSCLQDGSAVEPLALVDSTKLAATSESRGLQREYLEALNANIKAREAFKACCQEPKARRKASSPAETQKVDRLQEHLATIGFQKKHEKLLAVERHLDLLSQKPAASKDFLDPKEAFRDCRPLPEVPKDVVTALALDDAPATTHLKDLIDELEKHVLCAKLLLKREEQLLEQVKSRSPVGADSVPDSAKLEALNASRTELINWIETELGRAGDGGGDEDGSSHGKSRNGATDMSRLDDQLAGVREKYKRYVEARKVLLQLVSQQKNPVIKPRQDTSEANTVPVQTPAPSAHLLAPYVEQLLSVAHEQKGMITQKSHLNITIAKQLKDTCLALDHLAEESQLLPAFPMPGAAGRKPAAFGDSLSASETLDSSIRVQPWVFAAESAKIATLENVAEKIDEGQSALEASMQKITEINQLLGPHGKKESEGSEVVEDESVDDIWLAESRPSGKAAAARKHATKAKATPRTAGDIWDTLDGKLGLLRSESGPP